MSRLIRFLPFLFFCAIALQIVSRMPHFVVRGEIIAPLHSLFLSEEGILGHVAPLGLVKKGEAMAALSSDFFDKEEERIFQKKAALHIEQTHQIKGLDLALEEYAMAKAAVDCGILTSFDEQQKALQAVEEQLAVFALEEAALQRAEKALLENKAASLAVALTDVVVSSRLKERGEKVEAKEAILSYYHPQERKIEAPLPQDELSRFHVGEKVLLRFDPIHIYEGVVVEKGRSLLIEPLTVPFDISLGAKCQVAPAHGSFFLY